MPIVQQGQINTTALVVPDLYVQIVPPQNLIINGVPTSTIGVVGSASWGPVGQPVIVATMADYARNFGPVMNRKYDMGTHVATAVQQGAQNFRCVRVTDGTDVAASGPLNQVGGASGLMLTAIYTGSVGNLITVSLSSGSAAGSWRLTVGIPNQPAEVFDNVTGTGAALWANLMAAVNNGTSVQRGPSRLVIASAGSGAPPSPYVQTGTLGGGSDGATSVTASMLIGVDTLPRKGMYALRAQGCSIGVLADTDDSSTWTTQAGFGLAEGIYMVVAGPAGDTISNAISVKQAAGLDSYAVKCMFGDWIWWADQTNGIQRLVSPQGFVAGRLANLSPEQSSLNKQLFSVIGSQKSGQGLNTSYSNAELQSLFLNAIDVVSNPQPGGSYWGVRCGHNSSSNPATNGDNYTRLTNYIASTLAAGMGVYIGQLINADLFRRIRATLLTYLGNLLQQGQLGSTDGSLPFSVICDLSNNPQSRTALGYVQADISVRYQAINEKFIVNMEGGNTVQVQRQILPPGQA